jgi:UDP-N-acetylmuramoyl-tripeptide--D-alanyl-D-alanine ligase
MKNIFKKIIVSILSWEARLVLKKYHPKVIAITGSVGKTSTKDAVYTVLSHFYSVRKSAKSFNSEIGLPLTILGFQNGWNNPFIWLENIFRGFWLIIYKHKYPKYLVLEVGAGKPNDIKNVAPWLAPDVVVLTRFPDVPVHVEFFGSTERLIEEKVYLAQALKKDGVLIVNHDDKAVYNVHHKIKRRFVSYGFDDNANYKASYVQMNNDDESNSAKLGMHFKMQYNGSTFPVSMNNIVGTHHIYAGLVALSVAVETGCDILESIKALAGYTTPCGRLSVIEGMNNSTIIDDTYNASPVAMEAALEVLESLKGKRRIALLGDMLELGKMTEDAHKKVGIKASGIADIIVLVGPRSKFIADGALENGFTQKNLYSFESSMTAGKFLLGIIEKGDIILAKGSQGIRMERAVKMIMNNPNDASKLLCRQEKEWEKR